MPVMTETNETVLQAEHLSAGYEGRTVLSDISFAIHPGELVGFLGANGAGKSTLLKTLRGIQPALGRVGEIGRAHV